MRETAFLYFEPVEPAPARAATVIEFTKQFPDTPVYARGSNEARTRLYQMGISSNWDEIQTILDVYGYRNHKWEPF